MIVSESSSVLLKKNTIFSGEESRTGIERGWNREKKKKKKKKSNHELTLKNPLCASVHFSKRETNPSLNGSTFKSWCLTTPKVCPVHSITYHSVSFGPYLISI